MNVRKQPGRPTEEQHTQLINSVYTIGFIQGRAVLESTGIFTKVLENALIFNSGYVTGGLYVYCVVD